ncbi:hypothetical protein OsI_33634 [Oryza sativa Indica Group]|uniref:Uncharacterized protein n=1 Tax=Oryza sativa subsp. indica TaxID=39946 RepID=B8BGX2_ORYSI|nr:hypothetical protein OsI_33634 [Oryza sativa Indica Group]
MVVFAFLDVVDVLLCFVYGFLYSVFEDNPASCYCHGSHNARHWRTTRYHWRSACRHAQMGLLRRHDNGRLHFVVNQPQPPNGLNSQVSTASVISVTIIRLPPPPSVVDSNRGRRRRFAPPADDPTNTSPANGVLEESPWSACGAREGREESSACRVLRPLFSAVSRCTDPPPRQPLVRPPRQ